MSTLPSKADPRLTPRLQLDRICSAVATTPQGRIFLGFPGADGPGMQVGEATPDGRVFPYPDGRWNRQQDVPDPENAFVRVNSLRIGPDGNLWIIDAGAPAIGARAVEGGARLIVVDLATDTVIRVYDLRAAIRDTSYVDDFRFNGDRVYLTDAGAPGLLVLDLAGAHVRRVLDGHPSTVDQRSMHADGQIPRDADGVELRVHADQLEVSPDGAYLYYQPASGPLSRIATRWLDDPAVDDDERARHVEDWVDTPTTGGTAIDADGTIYLSDPDNRRILTISAGRDVETLIADPRLIWSDAMWIDAGRTLWIPATQQNLTPGFAAGHNSVDYPIRIYTMPIDAVPAPNDHH